MPLDANRPGFIRKTLRYRKKTKFKNKTTTALIAVVALTAAIAFSVSVGARSAGWLWKSQPSTPSKAESTKNSSSASATAGAHRPLGPNAAPLAPPSPVVTASKTDALVTDVDMDGKADPGDTLRYTVTIGSSGADATGVQFNDTVDPNTAFVAGTLAASPVAVNDTFPVTVAGNIRINSANLATPFSVVANDYMGLNPTSTISAFDATTANGGQIVMTTSGVDIGKFTYNPPAGFEGVDTFTYTLTDNANATSAASNRTATVSITVSGMIWFINNNASCPCDGRLTNPFNTLASFDAVNDSVGNHPAANDNIFVYESATDYVGPVTLENGQKFIGQDATATLSSISGVNPPTGSDALPVTSPGAPIVNITSAGNGINVAQNNTLRGFTGGNAAVDINGSGIGTLNVSDVTLNGTGGALNLSTGTLNGTFGSISSSNSATTGISLTSIGGSLTTGSTTITNSTGIGISVNTSSATFNFAATSVTGSGNTGISLTTNTGPFTFGALTITPDSNQRGLLATDNSGNITIPSGTVTTTGGVAVEITKATGTTPLTVSLTSVSANGGTGGIVLTNTNGSFTITGGGNTSVGGNSSGGTIQNVTGHGIAMSNVQNPSFTNINIQSAGRSGVDGQGVTNFTLANSTINNVGTAAVGQFEESNISFNDGGLFTSSSVSGVVSITQNTLTNARRHGIDIENGTGTISNLTITNNTLTSSTSSAVSLGTGILILPEGSAGTTAHLTTGNISNNTITNFPSGEGIALLGGSGNTSNNTSSTLGASGTPVNITNNTIAGQAAAASHLGSNAIRASMNSQVGVMNVNINCNGKTTGGCTATGPITNIQGQGISVFAGGTITGTATITNNVIVANQTLGAGTQGLALQVDDGPAGLGTSAANYNTTISNNSVSNYEGNGIRVIARASLGFLDATIQNNTVGTPILANRNGIRVDSGSGVGDVGICMNMTGNTSAGSGVNAGIGLRKQGTVATTNDFGIVGLSPSPATAAQAEAKVEADNPAGNGVDILSGDNFVSCTQTAGPITASSVKGDSLSAEAQFTRPPAAENVLWASNGENKDPQHVSSLTESEVTAMAQAALARWAEAGLSDAAFAKLQGLKFEVANLPDGQLATANSSKITLDETAAGYGWFFDTTPNDDSEFEVSVKNQELQTTDQSAAQGHIDLLTVLMRQLGSQVNNSKSALKGPQSWLMEGSLDTGTRRAPVFKTTTVGKVKSAPDAKLAKRVPAATDTAKRDEQVASAKAPRSSRVLRNHARRARAPMSAIDVSLSFGTIPAGKSVTVNFNVTVDDPFPGPGAQVCNQGTVSGTNFGSVSTDDPAVGGIADQTCTPIDLQADLEVTKTDTPDPVIAGNNLTYTINFKNNGPNASGATVTDATPVGTTFVSASVQTGTGWGTTNPAVGSTGNVVFTKALVNSGETAVFQIVVKVNSSVAAGSTISNSATATTSGATDPVPGNNTGTASTSVIAQADLSITKTDGATTEIPGTSISYTITVNNSGPSDANGVSVADTFPSDLTGVTFTSVAAGGATGNTAAGSGNISDTVNMPAGSSITYTVNATIKSSATGSLSNTATVTAPVGVTDPDTSNNSATDTDTLVPTADLSITKTDGVTSKVPGTSVTYTIVVSNSGPSDAPGTTVADTFPSDLTGVTFTSVAAGGATGNTASGSGNINDTLSLPSGSSVTYTVNATVKASATGSLSNTATVTAGAGVTDPTPGNNSATDTDTLTPQADLSITKTDGVASATPGTSVTYTITVTNNGPSDAPGTTVGDLFPGTLSGVTFTSVAAGGATGNTLSGSGNINDTLNMPAGSSVTYTATGTIAASATGTLSNTATVAAGAGVTDPTPGNNSATDTDTLTASADVSVTKTDSPDPVIAGNNITYTITVSNAGPSDAQSLSLSDAVPANTTLVSVTTPAGWTRTDVVPAGGTGTLTFTRPTQAAGASSIFTVVVNVTAGTANGTTITNTANVSSTSADPTPGNNSATATTLVQNNADVAITKTRSPGGTISAGTNVTYTIQFTNNGPAPASNVTVTDTLPAGVTVVSQSNPAGWTCNTLPVGGTGTITCTKASMANAESATLTVVVAVSCSVADGATINNTATIASGAGSPPDNNTANNSSTASFTVSNPAVTVVASVAISQLPQNSHDLINVGLAALVSGGNPNCPPGPMTVQVFGDEDDETPTAKNEVFSPDAKDIAVSTLRLRGERVNTGDGRVYLIVVRSGSSFSTVTVVVPKSSSAKDVNSVNAQAAAAKAFADANNGAAPAGYFVIGDGPVIGPKQ